MGVELKNYLHLARPLATAPTAVHAPSTSPVSVIVHPQALFSIIDHASRRPADQQRVIGTLLGTRSEDGTEVTITNCYAVPHTETAEQVEMEMDSHKHMLELHLRVAPKEILVGWYATSSELNTFSALIQNFYGLPGDGTWPHPAVHLTVNTEPGKDVDISAYISAPIGVVPERTDDSCLFIPVPYELRYGEAERSGLEAIAAAKDREDRSQLLGTDLDALEGAVEHQLDLLERASNYVSNVLDEEVEPSAAIGQYLLNTLSLTPKVDPEAIERDMNHHAQDVLMVAYLANTIKTQIDLSNRLATAPLTVGDGEKQQKKAKT
ncbi:eukaryotic translation initiation factor 3 subunit F [Piedraia hortae CBS 480.64]|uniref:Eukaryotic translation initiation factor 3 subunit F n=1 Tax=Piedraia hortae CBS 480.64 TaxID=1314780 RepID=A0A6A7CAC7_9PEZI|nr:eukaryotic translation initiation factor 3 subunit F [Piedraia hortae CBS 480.64]